jgi:signal transduction histidine kinase
MIPYLKPLKNSIWIQASSLIIASSILSVSSIIIIISYLPSKTILAIAVSVLLTVVFAILAGLLISKSSVEATNFLAQVILITIRPNSPLEAPSSQHLSASKDFLLSLANDIYELKSTAKHEEENVNAQLSYYKAVLNNIPIPVIVIDKNQSITYTNPEAISYAQLSEEDIEGRSLYDVLNMSFVSEMTLDAWLDTCKENAVTQSSIWERVRLNLPDKSRKQFDLAAHFSKDSSNGAETILLLFDRTKLYETDDHDLTFVSLAVHELRTPLTIMRGYIEVFEDELADKLNREQKDFMHNMAASAQQLSTFVSNILNVARIEENALVMRLTKEDWDKTLRTACKDMELRAKARGKKLIFKIDKNLPPVAVDRVSIYEVVNNLLDNAVKYMHTDQDIIIRSYEKDGFIETTITDTGIGIPDNLLDHIFDKFYRSHTSKNSVGGTGLGLYLCKSIISAHGGSMWVQSKEGKGSTFGFSLPTYLSVADNIKNEDNGEIIRGAHGWIKNHSLYRD